MLGVERCQRRGSERLHRRSTGGHSSRHRSGRDLDDAELQRAIQLSLQEADGAGGPARPGYVPSQPTYVSEPPIVSSTRRPSRVRYGQGEGMEEDDPDLRAAIEASLREANAPRPSAPVAPDVLRPPSSSTVRGQAPPEIASLPPAPSLPNYDLDLTESDAILTFNQTIEQVQAQGGKDMSRYPHVNELYEKANGLRPKLALSLDDTGRKEQMLTDMNEKLSQAVKLYDKLLTEQVSHPTWRQQQQQQPTPTVSTHQQTAQYMPGYQTLNGYVPAAAQPYQQAAPFSPRSSVMSPPPLAQAPHAPTATAAAPAPVLPTPFVGTHVQEASYTHAQPQANVPVQPQWYPSQPQQRSEQPQVISPPPTQQQQQQPQPQPQPQQLGQAPPQTLYSPLQQQQQQQAQRQFTIPVATPAQSNLQQEQLQRQFSMSPQVMASAQSVQPVQFATPQQPDPSQLTVQHAPPAGIPQQALQFAQLQTSHIPVPTAPPPPPPQQQEVGAPPQVAKPVPIVSHIPQEPHPTTRAGTYALPGSASLSRHHTITAPATPLPQFPIAPTSAPMQAWPSVPTPQSERKEALLIDL